MWTKWLISCVALTAASLSPPGAGPAAKVALIADQAFDLHKSPLVSLLEVKLSEEPNLVLLQRTEIDRILREQQLTHAAFHERRNVMRLGRLLRADAFLLLSAESAQDPAQGEDKLLRVRLSETAHGLRLLDCFEQWDNKEPEKAAERIVRNVVTLAGKLTLAPGRAMPVGIVDIHRVQLGPRYAWLERVLSRMMSARLSKEPRIIMLERENLKVLHDEKLFAEGEESEFWTSALLVDGYLQRGKTQGIEMKLRLKRAFGEEIASFTEPLEPNGPSVAVDNAAAGIVRELLNCPPATAWQPEQEAEEFFRQGRLLMAHARHEDAIAPLESAYALQPRNLSYTWTLFRNEWGARTGIPGGCTATGTGISYYSDLELAELVSRLVRQIRTECDRDASSADPLSYGSLGLGIWRLLREYRFGLDRASQGYEQGKPQNLGRSHQQCNTTGFGTAHGLVGAFGLGPLRYGRAGSAKLEEGFRYADYAV